MDLGLQDEERGREENEDGPSRSENCDTLPENCVNENDRALKLTKRNECTSNL